MRVSGIAGTNPAKSPNFSYTKIKLKTDTPNKTKIKKTLKKDTQKTHQKNKSKLTQDITLTANNQFIILILFFFFVLTPWPCRSLIKYVAGA